MKKRSLCWIMIAVMLFSVSSAFAAGSDQFAGMKTYPEGGYKVGRDFDAGEYVLLRTGSYDGTFEVSRDANQTDMVFYDRFETNAIITVLDGEYLKLSGCMAILAEDFYREYSIKSEKNGTTLKVGYDIRAGEYKLAAAGNRTGYYMIYNDSRRESVAAFDSFQNSTWVTVRSGQYIVLSNCHIDQ